MTPLVETEQRSSDSLSAYGIARSTISGSPLSPVGTEERSMLTGERATTWRSA